MKPTNLMEFGKAALAKPSADRITQDELELSFRLDCEGWAACRLAIQRALELRARIEAGASVELGQYRFDPSEKRVVKTSPWIAGPET